MYDLMIEAEHRVRERGYQRALGDPERHWLFEASLRRPGLTADLNGLARSVRALALTIAGLF